MTVTGAAITSALNALRLYSRRVDRAAESIAAAGLVDLAGETDAPETTPAEPLATLSGDSMDLAGAMTSMLIAQRAFVAQLRVLKTADEMLKETVDVVK
jgi:flagellar basal body rod protein FlgF